MDSFKAISQIAKSILNEAELEIRFASEPEEVIKEVFPSDYECSDEEFADIIEQVKERVKIWGRNTGNAV